MPALESIAIAGYKSIQEMELELRPLNILIGANGAGKSNFINVFQFLRQTFKQNLELHVNRNGAANSFLHFGRAVTRQLIFKLQFLPDASGTQYGYSCRLVPTTKDTFVFADEMLYQGAWQNGKSPFHFFLGSGHRETKIGEKHPYQEAINSVKAGVESWRIYHFHDTSENAPAKQTVNVHDNDFLRPDGANLAPYLYYLREAEPNYYHNIVDTIRLVAPFFDDFVLRESSIDDKIRLEWREKGSDAYFDAHALSDGTLRFISLATLLLQPPDQLPTTILLDEPELGLHPYAINVLGGLLRSTAQDTQIIVSTQSVTLVNQFDPEDLIIVERENGASTFRRPDEEDIAGWLEGYSLGELWEKNVLGGRP